jgi:hypothetical protein
VTRRALAAYLGACVCLTWALLTAIAHLRRPRPEPPLDPADAIQVDWYPQSLTSAGGEVYWH